MNQWKNEHILLFGVWLIWVAWLLILYQLFISYVTFLYVLLLQETEAQSVEMNWRLFGLYYWEVQEWVLGEVQLESRLQMMRKNMSHSSLHFSCRLHSLVTFFTLVGKMGSGSSRPTLSLMMLGLRARYSLLLFLSLAWFRILLCSKHCAWGDGRERGQPRSHTLPWVVDGFHCFLTMPY